MFNTKNQIEELLIKAGIKINGPRGSDLQVFDKRLYARVLMGGSLAVGESYMDGWWDSKNLDQFFYKVLSSDIEKKFRFSLPMILSYLSAKIFNLQKSSKSFEVGEKHYDIGNDIYKAMLGKTMSYSCGYWKKVPTLSRIRNSKAIGTKKLDDAQEAKYNLICQKIGIKKGDNILDIGCGWGTFLKFVSEKYGARGLGVTVSKEQLKLASQICSGLPIKIKLQDYRSLGGKFDHIISIGMFEHVGAKNYKKFMEKAHSLLKDNGLFLLHTIGANESLIHGDPWLEKYIFPNGMLPSIAQIGKSIEKLFVVEDWHNFGADYDKTLMAWFFNFDKAWPELKKNYSENFYRMWKYYLLSCAGLFRARKAQLWQIVLSKKGVFGGYKPIR